MSCPMVSNGGLQEHGRLPEEVLLDPHPVENSISYIMSSGLLWKELIPTPTTHPWRGFCSPCRQISCLKITREVCAGSFRLRLRLGQDRQSWDWVSTKKSCHQCTNTSRSLTSGTILQGVKAKHFLTFFDCMCMWSFDYPSWIIIREAGISIWHQQLNQWEEVFHQAVKADLWHHATSYSITSTSLKSANQVRKLPPKKVLSKKPARQVRKTAMKKQHAIKTLSSKVHAPCKRPATCSKFNHKSSWCYVLLQEVQVCCRSWWVSLEQVAEWCP